MRVDVERPCAVRSGAEPATDAPDSLSRFEIRSHYEREYAWTQERGETNGDGLPDARNDVGEIDALSLWTGRLREGATRPGHAATCCDEHERVVFQLWRYISIICWKQKT